MENYQKELKDKQRQIQSQLRKQLPSYIRNYLDVKMISCRLSTVNMYAHDLLVFLEYEIAENPLLEGKEPHQVPIDVIAQLDHNDINGYLSYLKNDTQHYRNSGDEASPYSLARVRSSLSGFFEYLLTNDYISKNPVKGSERIRLKKEKTVDRLDGEKVNKLIEGIQQLPRDRRKKKVDVTNDVSLRDIAIITLIANTGVRISECVNLDLSDVDFEEQSLQLIRKGGKRDKIYFNAQVGEALKEYISIERPDYKATEDETALFLSNRKKRMAVRSIQEMLDKYGKIILPGEKRLYPHKLRKSYGSMLYNETRDLELVANVLGHDEISVAHKFYVDGEQQKKDAKNYSYRDQTE